jgi:hypothetical protein
VTLAPGLDTYVSRLDQHLAARQGRATLARVAEPAAVVPTPEAAADPPISEAVAAASASLASAFSAILAEERGEGPASVVAPVVGTSGGGLSDAAIEEIARRVVATLTDKVLREEVTARVLEVAERLISEEIERIKSGAH